MIDSECTSRVGNDFCFVSLSQACTAMGACLVPFSFLTVWELTKSTVASGLAGSLILFGRFLVLQREFE